MPRPPFRFVLVLAVAGLLAGCGAAGPPRDASPVAPPGDPEAARTQRVARLWSQSCALCHVDGTGGAPRLGNAAEWEQRIAQGNAALLRHTLEGFNNMPPLGYCMGCEQADFEALIQFMTGNP